MTLIHYRPFRNSDPPALAAIWRSQPPERALVQPISADLFDQFVFAKPYFDNQGLIVAVDDGRPIGFVHAAFGPSADEMHLATDVGTTLLLMVRTDYQRRGIGAELLSRSEAYLRSRGTKVLYAGGIAPLNAFYLGLYGGSELPGILDSTAHSQALFRAHGYREIDRTLVLHRELQGFRAPIDRQQLQIRRRYTIEAVSDPPSRTWWEACTVGCLDRTRYELSARDTGTVQARVATWSIQPLAASWGVNAAGLVDLETADEHRRQGLATFLLSEVFRHLQAEGVSLVEVQTMEHNAAALRLYEKLGFRLVDQGAVLRKE